MGMVHMTLIRPSTPDIEANPQKVKWCIWNEPFVSHSITGTMRKKQEDTRLKATHLCSRGFPETNQNRENNKRQTGASHVVEREKTLMMPQELR